MIDIPISFEYQNQTYTGVLSQVSGGGSNAKFHLMINKFYEGQLMHTETQGWRFTSQTGKFTELSQFFGDYVTAWLQ